MKLFEITLLCLLFTFRGGLGQLSFIPSPNITILRSAVYRCSVDEGVPLTWTFNGTSSATNGWQSYIDSVGITLNSTGDNNGVLTVPGNNIALNGSTIVCSAFGKINEGVLDETESSALYIQGNLSAVNVTCQLQLPSLLIGCSWSTPFTLLGINITHYNIDIINSHGDIMSSDHVAGVQSDHTIDQAWPPPPYIVSVTPFIDDLEGESAITNITVEFTLNVSSLHHDSQDHLMMSISLFGLEAQPDSVILLMESVDRSENYTVNIDGGSVPLSGVVDVTEMSRLKNVTVQVMVYYNNQSFNSVDTHLIDTFDVINVSYTKERPTSESVCFECMFNPIMRNPRGCNVSYVCTNGAADGWVESNDCSDIAHEYTYEIIVYDIDRNSIPYFEEPAVVLESVTFDFVPSTSTDSVTTPTSSSKILSSFLFPSSSPTVNTYIPNPTSSSNSNTTAVIIISVPTLIICIILISIIVMVTWKMIKKQKTHDSSLNKLKAISINAINCDAETQYTQTELVDASIRPKPRLPPIDVSYSDVLQKQEPIGEYSTLNHHVEHPSSHTGDYDRIQDRHPSLAGHYPQELHQTLSLYSTLNNNGSSTGDQNYSALPGQASR